LKEHEHAWPKYAKREMKIHYDHSRRIGEADFVDLLNRSTLAERRPVDDPKGIKAMLEHANLLCTAWDGTKLVGVARSVTDFEYCCYLSDLAVDQAYQKQGIGRELIRQTQSRLGPNAKIILLAAPKAETYYPRLGFAPHRSAWVLSASKTLT
jgi:GNAT superfamily N-acetyltransferase